MGFAKLSEKGKQTVNVQQISPYITQDPPKTPYDTLRNALGLPQCRIAESCADGTIEHFRPCPYAEKCGSFHDFHQLSKKYL